MRDMNSQSLTVLDLFSGCGGLSLGFLKAGFRIVGGIEHDSHAANMYARNIFRDLSEEVQLVHARPRDITAWSPKHLFPEMLGIADPRGSVEVVIGGPPCQPFARIGRAKLRQTLNDDQAYLKDTRADLHLSFLSYVEAIRPKVVLMENVPEIMNFGSINVAAEIAVTLEGIGYQPRYTLLNSANFGVPQSRLRFFLMAFRNDLRQVPSFPAQTHRFHSYNGKSSHPAGHQLRFEQIGDSDPNTFHAKMQGFPHNSPPAVTVGESIRDMPRIFTSEIKDPSLVRDFSRVQRYRPGRPSSYASIMRSWPDFETDGFVHGHVIRYLPRDHEIFRRMKAGDQYPRAHSVAMEVFDELIAEQYKLYGSVPDPGTREYEGLLREVVPPYSTEKFPNKWQKLDENRPSHTITAHLGKDTYSHIHYDSKQGRVISVREAARLQSFPDGFQFPSAMSHAFRQIGNAVPPLLAFELAKSIKAQLGEG